MKRFYFFIVLIHFFIMALTVSAGTLEDVKSKGFIQAFFSYYNQNFTSLTDNKAYI